MKKEKITTAKEGNKKQAIPLSIRLEEIINDGIEIIAGRISLALAKEKEIAWAIKAIATDEEIPKEVKNLIVKNLGELEIEKVKDITSIISTLYDKRTSAIGEMSTAEVFDVTIRVVD